jgi:hypothetical protein
MNKSHYTIIALTIAVGIAGVLMFMLFAGGTPDTSFLPVAIIAAGLVVVLVGVVLYFRKGSGQTGQQAKPARYAIGMAILGAVMAQAGGILPGIFNDKHGDGSFPWIIFAAVFAAMGGVIAAVSPKKGKQSAAAATRQMPWVLVMLAVMLAVGVAGTIVGIFAAPKPGENSAPVMVPVIGLFVLVLAAVLVFKLILTGTRSSAYALPDILPAAGPPTDPHFVRGGYWDGTKLLNKRVWGIPVPVTGRGYFIQGQGKAWLADEVLAFHLYLTRNPLVIPYGIIHGVETKKLILRKNHFPGPGMSIIWGRPDLPMVTTIQVTQNKAENELWAQEIMRRAGEWKDKMAAIQAEGAV